MPWKNYIAFKFRKTLDRFEKFIPVIILSSLPAQQCPGAIMIHVQNIPGKINYFTIHFKTIEYRAIRVAGNFNNLKA